MEPQKQNTQSNGMPWEAEYGYAQGLEVNGTVWLFGQVGQRRARTSIRRHGTKMR